MNRWGRILDALGEISTGNVRFIRSNLVQLAYCREVAILR